MTSTEERKTSPAFSGGVVSNRFMWVAKDPPVVLEKNGETEAWVFGCLRNAVPNRWEPLKAWVIFDVGPLLEFRQVDTALELFKHLVQLLGLSDRLMVSCFGDTLETIVRPGPCPSVGEALAAVKSAKCWKQRESGPNGEKGEKTPGPWFRLDGVFSGQADPWQILLFTGGPSELPVINIKPTPFSVEEPLQGNSDACSDKEFPQLPLAVFDCSGGVIEPDGRRFGMGGRLYPVFWAEAAIAEFLFDCRPEEPVFYRSLEIALRVDSPHEILEIAPKAFVKRQNDVWHSLLEKTSIFSEFPIAIRIRVAKREPMNVPVVRLDWGAIAPNEEWEESHWSSSWNLANWTNTTWDRLEASRSEIWRLQNMEPSVWEKNVDCYLKRRTSTIRLSGGTVEGGTAALHEDRFDEIFRTSHLPAELCERSKAWFMKMVGDPCGIPEFHLFAEPRGLYAVIREKGIPGHQRVEKGGLKEGPWVPCWERDQGRIRGYLLQRPALHGGKGPMTERFGIEASIIPGGMGFEVQLRGEFECSEAQNLREEFTALLEQGPSFVILNLDRTDYLCSCGLGRLVFLQTLCRSCGIALAFVGGQEQVLRKIRLCKLDSVFRCADSREEAMEILGIETGFE